MTYTDREIDRMADNHNNLLLRNHLDSQDEAEAREEAIEAYVAEHMDERILDWLAEAEEGVVYEIVENTVATETEDKIAAKMIRLIVAGETVDNNFKLLGKAFYSWIHKGMASAIEPELRAEAEKELFN